MFELSFLQVTVTGATPNRTRWGRPRGPFLTLSSLGDSMNCLPPQLLGRGCQLPTAWVRPQEEGLGRERAAPLCWALQGPPRWGPTSRPGGAGRRTWPAPSLSTGTHLFLSVDSHTLTTLMTSLTVLRKSCILAATRSAGKEVGVRQQNRCLQPRRQLPCTGALCPVSGGSGQSGCQSPETHTPLPDSMCTWLPPPAARLTTGLRFLRLGARRARQWCWPAWKWH